MNARDAMLEMLREYDGSIRSLTNAMGRAPGYLNNIINKSGAPMTDTLAEVANHCGYDLLLRRRIDDYEIPIDPLD